MGKNKDYNSNTKNNGQDSISEKAAERLQARSFWENYFNSEEVSEFGKRTYIGIGNADTGNNKKPEDRNVVEYGGKPTGGENKKRNENRDEDINRIKYASGYDQEKDEIRRLYAGYEKKEAESIDEMADKYWKIPEVRQKKNVNDLAEKRPDGAYEKEAAENSRKRILWKSVGGYEDEEYLASVNKEEETQDKPQVSYQNIFTGIAAAVIIMIICVLNILIPDKDFSEKEKRTLTSMPRISYASIVEGTFASDMENYVTDQFPFRDMWIRLRSSAETALGKYYANGVYKGSDGYLLEDINEPDHTELAHKIKAINTFAESNENIGVYMMLVPNAANIMKDYLPAYAPVKNQNADMDSVIFRLSPAVNYIDVRNDFIAEIQAENQIYYRTDHHWTSYGAFRALLAASGRLGIPVSEELYTKYIVSDDFYGTLSSKSGFPAPVKDFVETYIPNDNIEYVVEYVDEGEKTASVYRPENLDKADKYTVFFGGNYSEVKISSAVKNDDKLLIVKDSYANCFVPMLIPYYSEIIMIDPRYYYGNLYTLAEEEGVNKVMFLYNANTFFDESSITNLLESEFS